MGRAGPSKKEGCLRCPKREKCRKPCERMLRMLPDLKNTTGISLEQASPLKEDVAEEEVKRPREIASYASQTLLALAEAMREKFTAEEWRALTLVWAQGYRRSEAADAEGVSDTTMRKRMHSAMRKLREEFAGRGVI